MLTNRTIEILKSLNKDELKRFGDFIAGFYWQNREKSPWTSQFTEKVPSAGHWPFVYDGPTWNRGRTRAEPWFGQDQARLAGDLLADAVTRDVRDIVVLHGLESPGYACEAGRRGVRTGSLFSQTPRIRKGGERRKTHTFAHSAHFHKVGEARLQDRASRYWRLWYFSAD